MFMLQVGRHQSVDVIFCPGEDIQIKSTEIRTLEQLSGFMAECPPWDWDVGQMQRTNFNQCVCDNQ